MCVGKFDATFSQEFCLPDDDGEEIDHFPSVSLLLDAAGDWIESGAQAAEDIELGEKIKQTAGRQSLVDELDQVERQLRLDHNRVGIRVWLLKGSSAAMIGKSSND